MLVHLIIAAANCITPACILYTSIQLFSLTFRHPNAFDAYAILETLFYFLYLYRKHQLQLHEPLPRAPTPTQRLKIWKDNLEFLDAEGAGVDEWLRGWFFVPQCRTWMEGVGIFSGENRQLVDMGEIRRGNVEEWLAAAFFALPLPDLLEKPTEHHALLAMVFALEHRRKHRFPTGYNPNVRAIRPAMDKVECCHRPLVFYVVIALFEMVVDAILGLVGFKSFNGYHYHPGIGNAGSGIVCFVVNTLSPSVPNSQPIMFLHGLGGYAPHVHLILALLLNRQPMFIIHQPHISFGLGFRRTSGLRPIPNLIQKVDSAREMLSRHGFPEKDARALVVSHSAGSALSAALSNTYPKEFTNIMIDPIAIRIYDPHLARAFVCKPETTMGHIIRYFCREIGVAHYFARHFDPFDACLLDASKSTVVMGRNDCLIPVESIERYCKRPEMRCEVLENIDHGMFLASMPVFLQVLGVIKAVQREESPEMINKTPVVTRPSAPMEKTISRKLTLIASMPSKTLRAVESVPLGLRSASCRNSRPGTPRMEWEMDRLVSVIG